MLRLTSVNSQYKSVFDESNIGLYNMTTFETFPFLYKEKLQGCISFIIVLFKYSFNMT